MAVKLGDKVVLPQGQTGVLKWTGRIQGKSSEYAGVELTGEYASLGKHSGEFQGHQYFETSVPGAGLFVLYTKLVSASVQTPSSRLSMPSQMSPLRSTPQASAGAFAGSGSTPNPASQPVSRSRLTRPMGLFSPQRDISFDGLYQTPGPAGFGPPNGHAVAGTPGGAAAADVAEELAKLKQSLEEKDQRIQAMRSENNEKRREFRENLSRVQADRDETVRDYEQRFVALKEECEDRIRSGTANGAAKGQDEELERQRTALAAMQNRLLADTERIREEREQLEKSLAEAEAAREKAKQSSASDDDLALVVEQLESQEKRFQELQESLKQMDTLKEENQRLKALSEGPASDAKTEALEAQLKTLETHLGALGAQLKTAETQLTDKDTQLKALQVQFKDREAELKAAQEAQQVSLKSGQGLDDVKLSHQKELAEHKAAVSAHRKELSEQTSKLDSLRKELDAHKASQSAKEDTLAETEKELQKHKAAAAERQKDADALKQAQTQIRSLQHELESLKANAKDHKGPTSSDVERLEQALEAKVVREMELEEQLEKALASQTSRTPDTTVLYVPPGLEAKKYALNEPIAIDSPSQSRSGSPESKLESKLESKARTAPKLEATVPKLEPAEPKPEKTDYAAGRDQWCGLCERDGHTAEECPYED